MNTNGRRCIFCSRPTEAGEKCVKFAFGVGNEWTNPLYEIHASCNPNRSREDYTPTGEYVKE